MALFEIDGQRPSLPADGSAWIAPGGGVLAGTAVAAPTASEALSPRSTMAVRTARSSVRVEPAIVTPSASSARPSATRTSRSPRR